MAGIFPRNGLAPGQDNQGLPLAVAPIAGCDALYYNERCAGKIDPIAMNRLISEVVCVLNELGVQYNCGDSCNLWTAVRKLQDVACRSELPAGTAWPPTTTFFRRILVDDVAATLTLYVWDCNDNTYRPLGGTVAAAVWIVCRSTLPPGAFPPTANAGMMIIDDTANPPDLWAWDCNDGVYRRVTGGTTGPCFDTATQQYCVGTHVLGMPEAGISHQIPAGFLFTASAANRFILGANVDPTNAGSWVGGYISTPFITYGTWLWCGTPHFYWHETNDPGDIRFGVSLWARVA